MQFTNKYLSDGINVIGVGFLPVADKRHIQSEDISIVDPTFDTQSKSAQNSKVGGWGGGGRGLLIQPLMPSPNLPEIQSQWMRMGRVGIVDQTFDAKCPNLTENPKSVGWVG